MIKIGDKVRTKSKEQLLAEGGKEQLYGLYAKNGCFVTNGMYAFLGQIATVKDVILPKCYVISADCARYLWCEDIIEKVPAIEEVTRGDLKNLIGKSVWYYGDLAGGGVKKWLVKITAVNIIAGEDGEPKTVLIADNGDAHFLYEEYGEKYFLTLLELEEALEEKKIKGE